MPHIHELINLGVPASVARMLGQNRATTVWAAGSSAEDAVELTTNFCLIATTGPGQGVSLDFATGAALSAFYNLGPDEALVYPAPGDNFNALAPDLPLALPAGATLIAVPSAQTWLASLGSSVAPPVPPPSAIWIAAAGFSLVPTGTERVYVDTVGAGAGVTLGLPPNDILVMDRTGMGGTWPIMCNPPGVATINGNPGYLVQGDWASASFIWDGANFGV